MINVGITRLQRFWSLSSTYPGALPQAVTFSAVGAENEVPAWSAIQPPPTHPRRLPLRLLSH